MNTRPLIVTLFGAVLSTAPVQAETELDRLRARVAEQERQIRMLEEENTRLKIDTMPRRGHHLQVGGTNLVTAPNPPSANPRPTASTDYTVVAGDHLVRIGRKLGVSADELAEANDLDSGSIIHPGQKLKVPANGTPTQATSPGPAAATPARTHTVRAGETFYRISRQHDIAVELLMEANPDTRPAALRVGQQICLPDAVPLTASQEVTNEEVTPESPEPASRATENRRQTIRTMTIDGEMSYGAFAARHGTTTERLNQLNGLDLDSRTVLAKGSELYVPAQP